MPLHGRFLYPFAGLTGGRLIADDALPFGHGLEEVDERFQKLSGLLAPDRGGIGLIFGPTIVPQLQFFGIELLPPGGVHLQMDAENEVGIRIDIEDAAQTGKQAFEVVSIAVLIGGIPFADRSPTAGLAVDQVDSRVGELMEERLGKPIPISRRFGNPVYGTKGRSAVDKEGGSAVVWLDGGGGHELNSPPPERGRRPAGDTRAIAF